jgi:hypothetical protein
VALFGAEHSSVGNTYNNIGLLLEEQGKNEDALECYKKARRCSSFNQNEALDDVTSPTIAG